MTTKKELYAQLEAMQAPRDSVVLMHTSLRAVGETEGRGEGLLEVLIDYFTGEGGLFCVPTHTWANIGKQPFTLDMLSHETCIGTFPNIAAAHPAGHRSVHPSHSMVVFGDAAKAEAFIADEPYVRTPCSPDGCYGKLYDMDGKILLVGVGQNNNTYLHSAEERLDVPGRVSDERVPMTIRLKSGEVMRAMHHHHLGTPSYHFHKMEPAFRAAGLITDGFIGKAPTMLCDTRGMYEVLKRVWEHAGRIDLFTDDQPLDTAWYC